MRIRRYRSSTCINGLLVKALASIYRLQEVEPTLGLCFLFNEDTIVKGYYKYSTK